MIKCKNCGYEICDSCEDYSGDCDVCGFVVDVGKHLEYFDKEEPNEQM